MSYVLSFIYASKDTFLLFFWEHFWGHTEVVPTRVHLSPNTWLFSSTCLISKQNHNNCGWFLLRRSVLLEVSAIRSDSFSSIRSTAARRCWSILKVIAWLGKELIRWLISPLQGHSPRKFKRKGQSRCLRHFVCVVWRGRFIQELRI